MLGGMGGAYMLGGRFEPCLVSGRPPLVLVFGATLLGSRPPPLRAGAGCDMGLYKGVHSYRWKWCTCGVKIYML